MSYGGDAGVQVFVFVVLGAEILLVPLTLLHAHDGAVGAAVTHTNTGTALEAGITLADLTKAAHYKRKWLDFFPLTRTNICSLL